MNGSKIREMQNLLPDGKVLITECDCLRDVAPLTELYDPATGTFGLTGGASGPTPWWVNVNTATLLPDGTVLIAGGYSVWLSPNPGGSSSAELYVPRLLTPPLVVNDLRFDLTVVTAGASYSFNISGSGLTAETFFDVRFTSPGNNASVVLNWQRGPAASHAVPVGTASGNWTINGVRAHQIEEDHTSSFVPVSATITVSKGAISGFVDAEGGEVTFICGYVSDVDGAHVGKSFRKILIAWSF